MKIFQNIYRDRQNIRQRMSACISWPVIFYIFLAILTALSLYPIWMNRFLPMQDYPQHLFLSQVIATYDNPAFNWKDYYIVDLKLRPYVLWYLAMKPLSLFYGVEVAGKLMFSVYILLISTLVLMSRRICPPDSLPWGALLLFPFAFSQIYFIGFPNYIISLPILFFAVLDLEELTQGTISFSRFLLHILYLSILYLNHPYTVLVYIGLALATGLFCWGRWKTVVRVITPALILGSVLTVWYVTLHGPSPAPNPYSWHITWLPISYPIVYYFLMFTGMRITIGPDWLALAAWCGTIITLLIAIEDNKCRIYLVKFPIYLYLACMLGYFSLPCWFGYYSYFNLRLAPVSYFMLAILFAHLRIKPGRGVVISILAILLVACSIQTQSKVSKSNEEIIPILDKTEKNALILPLLFNSASTVIEPVFFYQFHSHQVNYYHLFVGGGANPTLFRNAMIPVQYRSGVKLPFPEHPSKFSWSLHGQPYKYFLLRNAPAEFSNQLHIHCDLIARSGPWELFQNKITQPFKHI